MGVFCFLGMDLLRANPLGEQVTAGAAGFERNGNSLTVTQGTDRAVINWNSFSIGAGEVTRFVQPSSSSAVLNRVITANNPSQIYGTLQANGQVYLINPAGVLVGPGGLVDTASFVASTRDVADEEFMRGGSLHFTGASDAAILNQGRMEARQGDVFLIARQVSNEGQIMASDGTVGMVSGTEICLQALGPHSYKVRLLDVADGAAVRKAADGVAEVVNQGVIEAANAELEATGNYLSLAIRNSGTIRATGVRPNADGSVTLTGGEGDLLNQGVVAALQKNVDGKTTGGEISMVAKNITLDPASVVTAAGSAYGGKVAVDAKDTILASGRVAAGSEDGRGGKIVMTGERVGLVKAEVDASGATKGGEILVGGDYLGSNPEVRNAKATVMTSDSVIRANATGNGDGGKVILWSDEYTGFYGDIFARGGLEGGDGGFVETSSKFNLQAWGQADVLAPVGKSGTWLLDPYDVYITATRSTVATYLNVGSATSPFLLPANTFPVNSATLFDANGANAEIGVDRILFALNSGQNVIIRTGASPSVINPAGAAFNAKWIYYSDVSTQPGNIYVQFPIIADAASTGSLTLLNTWVSSGLGGGSIFVNQPITLGSGNLTLTAGDDRGTPLGTSAILLDRTIGGTGGSVFVNAALTSQTGRVTINAGQSVASWDQGTGGSVSISAPIYGGNGIAITAGAAQNRWNPVASNPLTPASPEPYVLQGSVPTAPTRNATAGSVNISSSVTISVGNSSGASSSSITSGTIGNNSGSAGSLTVASPFIALGNNVNLNFVTGKGTTGGVLTISSGATIGTSASPFNLIGIRAGGLASIQSAVRANNINFSAFDPMQSVYLNQNDITGINTTRINASSLNNLIVADTLFIGTSAADNPNITPASFALATEYIITGLGTTTQLQWNTIAGTTGLLYGVGSTFVARVTDATAVATTGTARINQGDIGIGQAGPVDFSANNVTFQGFSAGVSLDGSSSYAFSLPSGGRLRFDTQGEIFSNFGTASPDIYIPNGTVDFINVQAPGNRPSQAPSTGTIILSVANIQGANIVGDAYLQNIAFQNNTTGNINFSGNLTTVAGNVLGVAMPGQFVLTAAGAISQNAGTTVNIANALTLAAGTGASTLSGTLTVGQNMTFTSAGSILQNNGSISVTGISSFNGNAGITLTRPANDFTGAVTLASSAAGAAAVAIVDANALTLAAPSLGANTGISAVAGTTLTLPATVISTGTGNINFSSNGGALATAANLTTSSGTITLAGSAGLTLNHTLTTTLSTGNGGSLALSSTSGAVNQTGGSLVIQGTTQVTTSLANQSITLAQASNDFTGAVTLTTAANGNISVRDANALNIGGINMGTTGFPGNGSLTLAVGTALTQSGVINTGLGGVTINATAANSDVNLASFANAIRAANITFTTPANVRDYGLRTTFATADADGGLGPTPSITFPNLRNLTVLYDAAAINLPALTLATSGGQAGSLVLSSGNVAGVLQGGAWVVPGTTQLTTTLANAPITLTQAANDFTGAVTLTTGANGNISIRDANALNIGGINMAAGTGSLTLAVGTALTQSGVINTGTGGVTINATALNTDVNLASFANSIQAANITFTTPANVRDYGIRTTFATADADAGLGVTPLPNLRNLTVLYDAAAINLPALTLATSGGQAGSLVLSSGNLAGVLQGGAWVVPGTTQVTTTLANAPITLNNPGNNFTGAVSLASATGGNIGITDGTGGLTLGTLAVGGNLSAISTAAGGALDLGSGSVAGTVAATTSNGAINQTAALNLPGGVVTLTAGTGVINLGTVGNQISSVRIVSSGDATLRSAVSLDFASAVSTISGNLTVTAAGITDSARIVVVGNTTLNAGTSDIVLDNDAAGAANDYGTGLTVTSARNTTLFVPLTDEGILGGVVSTGEFVLRTDSGTGFNFPSAGGTGEFDLTTVQLQGFTVGTFTPQARGGAGLTLGTFTSSLFPGISGLKLVTTGGGAILGNGPITTGAFSFTSSGTSTFNGAVTANSVSFASTGAVAFNDAVAATDAFTFNSGDTATFAKAVSARTMDFTSTGAVQFGGVNAVQNLGTFSVTSAAPLSFQNNQSLNLTGTGSSGGRLTMQVAGYFNNVTGQENPLANVAGGSVIQSLSLFGPSLSQLYGLAGFSTRYDGSMPASGNVMSYVISPLNYVVPAGTTIAGVNLGGLPQAGQELGTFETGSNDLNWMVSDFAGFNLPQVPRAVMQYRLYPQRVETETRTLPEPTLGQLTRELGRPPTVEEVQAREVATREAIKLREGAILERSSFDLPEDSEGRYQEAKEGVAPAEGGTPQADVRSVPPADHSAGFLDAKSSPPQANGQRKNEGGGTVDPLRNQRSSKVCSENPMDQKSGQVLALR